MLLSPPDSVLWSTHAHKYLKRYSWNEKAKQNKKPNQKTHEMPPYEQHY